MGAVSFQRSAISPAGDAWERSAFSGQQSARLETLGSVQLSAFSFQPGWRRLGAFSFQRSAISPAGDVSELTADWQPALLTTARFSDVLVRGHFARAGEESGGYGIAVQSDADVVIERGLVERNHDAGVFLSGAQLEVDIFDLVVRDTQLSQTSNNDGIGLVVRGSATVSLQRLLLDGNHSEGIWLSEYEAGTPVVTAGHLIVRGTASRGVDGTFGRGLEVGPGAQMDIDTALFETNHDVSVHAAGAGTRLEASRLVVRATQERDCADSTCPETPSGVGVGCYSGADVTINEFAIQDSPLAGLQIATEATLHAENGVFSNNFIGISVMVPDFDLAASVVGERFENNFEDVAFRDLPLPEGASGLISDVLDDP